VAFEIIPGITSAIAAPAYAGIPVTHRDHNTSFTISTGHEDPTKGYSSLDFTKLANPKATTIFLMAMQNLGGIMAELKKNGVPGDMPVGIVREGTKPTQETLIATLDTIVAEVARTKFAAPAIVVVGHVVGERENIRWFDNGPLFGQRVLVTRPAAQSDDFAAQLWELGAEPLLAPTIAIGPPDNRDAARAAVERARSYAWIVFTSRNGVDAFFDYLLEMGRDARAFGDAKVAAIGPKTAEALLAHGIRVDLMPAKFINESVASDLISQSKSGDSILLFRAGEAREVLPETLRNGNRVVDDIAGYQTTIAHDPLIAEHAANATIFTFASASAVNGFVANVPEADTLTRGKIVACIGPVTAEAARKAGLHVDVVAEDYTVDGLVEALEHRLTPA